MRHICYITRWFQLHPRDYLVKHWQPDYWMHIMWLREECFMPVYVPDLEQWDDIPTAREYPKAEVEALTPHGDYHAGSFDWMVSLAILEEFEEIHIYGVNFGSGGEPLSALPCLQYWLGVAEGRGIKVHVEPPTDMYSIYYLTKTKRQYGWDWFQLVVDEEDGVEGQDEFAAKTFRG